MSLSPLLQPVSYSELPGWLEDDCLPAFEAFRRSAARVLEKPYRSGALGVTMEALRPAFLAALDESPSEVSAARRFFERHFRPSFVRPDDRERGFVTGFYEPEAEARRERSETFRYPVYARPEDLVDIDDTNRPAGLDPYFAFGRQTSNGIVEYHDRAAIEAGALGGCKLELFWLADRVDLFFIHVQGAARLRLPNGTVRRITYAAKSGQRFTGIGRMLADAGEIPLAEVTMQSIRAWLKANPERIEGILHRNRSFIFFREAPVDDPALGPVAAAKVPLTQGRSVAVDRLLHTFGSPIFISAPELRAFGAPFRRLMIAQDTGSAIVGAARGDLFAGSGDAAGEIAGVVRSDADFFLLVPRELVAS